MASSIENLLRYSPYDNPSKYVRLDDDKYISWKALMSRKKVHCKCKPKDKLTRLKYQDHYPTYNVTENRIELSPRMPRSPRFRNQMIPFSLTGISPIPILGGIMGTPGPMSTPTRGGGIAQDLVDLS